jgi:DNA-binding SARP family transcriptional activator/tetratricopeptide (TPR) repeat protein
MRHNRPVLSRGLEIRVLGELRVLHAGAPAPLPASRKARALLGYLIATAREHSRERLADLFWDAPDDPRAQLRWALWKLKPLLADGGASRLAATRERVEFDPGGVDVDLLRLRALVGGDPAGASTEALEEAARLFRGELLEGLNLPECYRYHEWCLGEREALRALHISILSALVARHAGNPEVALGPARRLVAVDPLREESHIEVVRLLGELGRGREALEQYENCRRILEGELGARPSTRLEQARIALSRSISTPGRPAPVPPPDAPPLFGRSAECALIEPLVAAAARGEVGEALLLVGEPGIGKTRMLEEAGRRMREAGGVVLYGRAFEAEQARPYGAWIDALRLSLAGDRVRILRAQFSPDGIDDAGPSGAAGSREGLFDSVRRLLAELSAREPVAVLLDDIQWLDEVSAALLHYLVRTAQLPRVLFACAARAGELSDNMPSLAAVRGLKRERRLREIALGPLDAQATAALSRSVAAEVDGARVFSESEGNALFALEVARALGRGESALSGTLDELIGDRLALLDENSREALPWFAAFGQRVSPVAMAEITQLPLPRVVAVFDELERRSIMRPAGNDGYDFTHDLIRRAAYQRIPQPRRRLLHSRIARGLAAMADAGGMRAGEVARHAAAGGEAELCVRYCVRAGEHCLRVFAFAEAEAIADLGRRHVAQLEGEERIRLHIALLRILLYPGVRLRKPEGLGAELARLCGEAQDAGMMQELATGLQLLGWMHHLSWGDFPRAREMVVHTMELVQKLPVPQNLEALVSSARCLAVMEVHMPKARAMFEELAAYGPAAVDTLYFQWGLGLVRRWEGDIEGARSALAKAARLARARGDPWAEFECTSALVAAELEAGRARNAAALCAELEPLAAKLGEGGTEGQLVQTLAALAAAAGGAPDGAETLDRALAELARMDAQYLLAYALNAAAEIEIGAGHWERAARRAREALGAAEIAGRAPEVARARVLSARAAYACGQLDEARREIERLREGDIEQLSARARASLPTELAPHKRS